MELVLIIWRDAYDPDLEGWVDREHLDKILDEDVLFESVGWVYNENEKYLTLVADHDKDKVSRVTRIPIAWIIKRERLEIKILG